MKVFGEGSSEEAGKRSGLDTVGGLGARVQECCITRCSKMTPCPRPQAAGVPRAHASQVELCDGVCIFHEDHLSADILKDPTRSSQSTRETKSPGNPDSAGRTEQ